MNLENESSETEDTSKGTAREGGLAGTGGGDRRGGLGGSDADGADRLGGSGSGAVGVAGAG